MGAWGITTDKRARTRRSDQASAAEGEEATTQGRREATTRAQRALRNRRERRQRREGRERATRRQADNRTRDGTADRQASDGARQRTSDNRTRDDTHQRRNPHAPRGDPRSVDKSTTAKNSTGDTECRRHDIQFEDFRTKSFLFFSSPLFGNGGIDNLPQCSARGDASILVCFSDLRLMNMGHPNSAKRLKIIGRAAQTWAVRPMVSQAQTMSLRTMVRTAQLSFPKMESFISSRPRANAIAMISEE